MLEQLKLFLLPPPEHDVALKPQHILLSGRIVTYQLRRDRQRLAMRIDERGLRVGAPRNLSLATVEAFIRQHADWVLDKLDAHVTSAAPRHLKICEGIRLPVLGRECGVRITQGNNRGYWEEDTLWLAARPAADLAQITRRALQRRAMEHFSPRVAEMVQRAGRPMPPLALSSARTRWGSCSAKSGIRLNWRLIHLESALIDYVIAHEVAHLVEMNHSPRFWRVVETLFPSWEAARSELRRQGAALPLI